MSEPIDEATHARPELDLLSKQVAGMQRSWKRELPMLEALAAQGDVARNFLQDVVQDYYWRSVSYGEACWTLLQRGDGISFLPIMRSLYEASLALAFLRDRDEAERKREAQVAIAHELYHVLWQIQKEKRPDQEGKIASDVADNLRELGELIPEDVLTVAEKRSSCFSWTGLDASRLITLYDSQNPYLLYSNLSNLAHGHHKLIARHVMRWTPEKYEEQAAHARMRLKQVRRSMQDLLALRFSDPEIDELMPGDVMLVRMPHANIRTARP